MVFRFHSLSLHLFLFTLVVVLLTSCGSSAEPAPAATIAAGPLPADWQRIELPQVSLALPPEWAVIDAADVDPSSAVAEMANQNPQLKAVLEQGRAALTSGQVQLIAYDLDPERVGETGFPTNIRIGHQAFSEPPTLTKVSDVNEQDLRKTPGFTDVQRTPVAIGNLPATRLSSKLHINDAAAQPFTLALEQYVIVSQHDVYVLTFTTASERAEHYRSTFDQILGTIRVEATS
jgi:hypothetical protein